MAPVKINGKWGFIDIEGNLIIKHKYDETRGFVNGYCAVKVGSNWGLINDVDKYVIEPKFEAIGNLKDGLVFFKKMGKYGYLDRDGKEIIPSIYDRASDFSNSFCIVYKGHKRSYLDVIGNEKKFPSTLESCIIYEFSNGYGWFKNENGWGVMDDHFNILLTPRFKKYFPGYFNNDGFCLISRSWEYHHDEGTEDIIENIGYIDIYGKEYWEESRDINFYIRKAKQRQENSPREAIFQYELALERDAGRHDILFEIGKIYLRLMEYGNAMDVFAKAAELDPSNFDYIFLKANALVLKGEYRNALEVYEVCRSMNDDNQDLHANIWKAKFELGDKTAYYSLLRARELGFKNADSLIGRYYQS